MLIMGHQEYSSEFKNQVVQFIIGRCIDIVPPRGTLKEAQLKLKISRQTCRRWWNAAKKQQQRGESMQLRCNLLSVAAGLGCSKATVWRWVKAGLIRPHTSAIKPSLTAANKLLRLRFTVESLELDRILNKIKTNQLPMDLEVPVELAMQAIAYLKDQGSNQGLEMIAQSLGL
ncbi:hypothetical protein SASPL_104504 [Salvia splendens]|uniref:Uncharacterized protein n=1 Tax=Salvia splendens TaxID=180675 RepID=A0A8X9AAQ9_SALSN|nr:hypothetical protein SASPL_104504 [Salvia splendens]